MTNHAELLAFATDVSTALKEFHRTLIQSEIGDDPVLRDSPYSALFALIGDPRFGWMGELSQLIAKIDHLVAEREPDEAHLLAEAVKAADNLVGAGEGASASTFRLRHVMALQKDPDVGLATGKVRKALSARPATLR
jgi:hypothetical protein